MKDIFLVDADDTLLDFQGSSAIALMETFHKFGISFEEEYFREFKRVNAQFWAALERKELTREELMARRFPVFLRKIGLEGVDGERFNHSFLTHLSNYPCFIEGAEDFLKELKKRGRVYIVTNGTAWIQKSRFKILNLYGYVEGVFISQEIGYDKPAKEFTDYVTAHIPQFCKERAVWIGDSAAADIKAANQANISSIWLNPKKKVTPPDVKVDYSAENFKEILQILKEIN